MDEIITPDSPLAAQYRTDISGWVSRNGEYFGDHERSEWSARNHGSTHLVCTDCGQPFLKYYRTVCAPCEEVRLQKAWEKAEKRPWDGNMIYSESEEEWYSSPDDIDLGEGETYESLRLYLSEPVYAHELDDSMWSDDLPDGDDMDYALSQAIDEFNEKIKGLILSYQPTRFALDVSTLPQPTP